MLIFSRYTWWIAAMVGLALLLTIMGQVGVLNPFQNLFLKAAAPVEGGLNAVFEPVATFLSDAGSLNDLRDENARLRVENEALRNKVTNLQQDAEQVNELKQALNIMQATSADTKIATSVLGRDNSPFTDVVSIDKGSNAGIKVGMVVLSSQGSLIGTVISVTADTSLVRLITDSKSRVNAEVQETKALGIVKGSPGRGLSFDLSQAEAKVGDTIVTSGLGGNYPPGVPIGTVSDVSGTNQDLYRKIAVEPLVRVSTARTLLVNTSFIPQRIGLEGP